MLVIGERHILDAAIRLYGIAESDCIQIDQFASANLADVDRFCLVGAPWVHFETIRILNERGLVDRAILPEAIYSIHEALLAAGGRKATPQMAYALVYEDFYYRQWFAYGLITAVAQAERLGLKALTVAEFGVWEGAGLLNMADLCKILTSCTGIEFRVVGFDTGKGLPSVADWRDHPELWYTGELVMPDVSKLRAKLPSSCELILGDIKDTIGPFEKALSADAPLGFFSLDVDTYSSSIDVLKILDIAPTKLLPATCVYVDDAYINIMQSEFSGEGLAITEFNGTRPLRRIAKKIIRTHRQSFPWHHTIHFAHIFDHPVRARHIGKSFIGLDVHKL